MTALPEILGPRAQLFEPGLGKIKGVQAKLQLREWATPRFVKARLVPYALKAAVETELDQMESSGIIEVRFSDWGMPLVCFLKKDGSVRLCWDYRTTIGS